jgi:NhaB family Na+:H+ antiporter
MNLPAVKAFYAAFLGGSPDYYKAIIAGCLVLNPLVLMIAGPIVAGWLILAEFIFTLAMSLHCYPLQAGGLLALEAVLLGLVSPALVYQEVESGFPIILLLIFMVAGIFFLKDLLLAVFSRLIVRVRSQLAIALSFCAASAALSAFLDALTVIAVIMTVALGFYAVYDKVAAGQVLAASAEPGHEHPAVVFAREDLDQFRDFLRGLLMHAAIGTTLGGAMTVVGEPQNLLIAKEVGWDFATFFLRMAPVTVPVFIAGIATCAFLERLRWFGYGVPLPANVRIILDEYAAEQARSMTSATWISLSVQAVVALLLIAGLAFHVAEVGLLGLMVIVLATAFTGITEEHRVGKAFEAALPFTALLVVFFAIVAVIHHQGLFDPVVTAVLELQRDLQGPAFYLANGLLSVISDNVFVASIYITQIKHSFESGLIDRAQLEFLAVAINTGTNIPSIATPNGQAAFLFLLTSPLAPLIRLSYWTMCKMALPYFVTMTLTGLAAIALIQ